MMTLLALVVAREVLRRLPAEPGQFDYTAAAAELPTATLPPFEIDFDEVPF